MFVFWILFVSMIGSVYGNSTIAVDTHNKYRSLHKAINVTWDTKVAQKAQQWVDGCNFGHDPSTRYGENIYASWGRMSGNILKRAVDSWYNEEPNYNYKNPGFSADTGHFTQVVWNNTKRIGCGVRNCRNGMSLVSCQYDPPGNYIGQFSKNVFPRLLT